MRIDLCLATRAERERRGRGRARRKASVSQMNWRYAPPGSCSGSRRPLQGEWAHQEHRRGTLEESVGDATEHGAHNPRSRVRRHDDEVEPLGRGAVQKDIRWLAVQHLRSHNTFAAGDTHGFKILARALSALDPGRSVRGAPVYRKRAHRQQVARLPPR